MNKTNHTILSIDPAKNSGIAYLKNNKITVFNCFCEDPKDFYPWFRFNGYHQGLHSILLEEFTYLSGKQNPVTTRELIKRIGHYQFRPQEDDIVVHMMHVGTVRKQLNIKGKSSDAKKKINTELRELTGQILTTDITDATVQLLAHLGETSLESINKYEFERIKNIKVT